MSLFNKKLSNLIRNKNTIGMDFGDLQIENGCFIEEDGSTYCFCEFNK